MALTRAPVLLVLLLVAPLLVAAQPDDTPDDFGAVVETEDQQLCDLTTLTFPASLAGEFGTEEPIPANYGNLTWSPQATLRRLSAGAPLFVRSKEALFFSVPDGFALTALWATVIDARIQPSQPAPNTTYTITISAVTTTGETKTSLCRVQVQTEFPSDVADLVPRGTAGRKMLQDVLPSPSPAPASLTAQEEPVFETRLDAFEEAPCDPSTDLNCNVDVVPVSKAENATLNAIPGTLCAIPTEQVMDFSNITSISITQLNQVDILPDGSYSTEVSTAMPAAGQVSVYGLAYQLKSPCPPKPLD